MQVVKVVGYAMMFVVVVGRTGVIATGLANVFGLEWYMAVCTGEPGFEFFWFVEYLFVHIHYILRRLMVKMYCDKPKMVAITYH